MADRGTEVFPFGRKIRRTPPDSVGMKYQRSLFVTDVLPIREADFSVFDGRLAVLVSLRTRVVGIGIFQSRELSRQAPMQL